MQFNTLEPNQSHIDIMSIYALHNKNNAYLIFLYIFLLYIFYCIFFLVYVFIVYVTKTYRHNTIYIITQKVFDILCHFQYPKMHMINLSEKEILFMSVMHMFSFSNNFSKKFFVRISRRNLSRTVVKSALKMLICPEKNKKLIYCIK